MSQLYTKGRGAGVSVLSRPLCGVSQFKGVECLCDHRHAPYLRWGIIMVSLRPHKIPLELYTVTYFHSSIAGHYI